MDEKRYWWEDAMEWFGVIVLGIMVISTACLTLYVLIAGLLGAVR